MEIAVGTSAASTAPSNTIREMDRQGERDSGGIAVHMPHSKATTDHADLASACDREQALELELRAPDGSPIETECIALHDTEFFLSLADGEVPVHDGHDEPWDPETEMSGADVNDFGDDDDLFDEPALLNEEFDLERVDEFEKPFPRYQIFVTLVDDADVP